MIALITKHPKVCGVYYKRISITFVQKTDPLEHFLWVCCVDIHGGGKYRTVYVPTKKDITNPIIMDYLKHL